MIAIFFPTGEMAMSDRYAVSCANKRHHNSERRARDAAKASQIAYGIPMNAYPCEHCKKWHVGSTYPQYSRTEREKQSVVSDS